MSPLLRIATILLGTSLTGCGTLMNLGLGSCPVYDHPRIYGGVRIDVLHIFPEEVPLGALFAVWDFPFSLAMDTLILPWSIPATLERGDKEYWPEPYTPIGIVEGVVIEGEHPAYEVVPAEDIWGFLPEGMKALPGATVRVFAKAKEPELKNEYGAPTSDGRGHFCASAAWKTPWKRLRVEIDGFQPVEIPVTELHSPLDRGYWLKHRILVKMAREPR